MSLPKAVICHSSAMRVRIRVRPKIGDTKYFDSVEKSLLSGGIARDVETNPSSGSVLIKDKSITLDELVNFSREKNLFDIAPVSHSTSSKSIRDAFKSLNRRLVSYTDGQMDFKSTIFVALLAAGLLQISRGNIALPPWYSAFWYALGLYAQDTDEAELIEETSLE